MISAASLAVGGRLPGRAPSGQVSSACCASFGEVNALKVLRLGLLRGAAPLYMHLTSSSPGGTFYCMGAIFHGITARALT